jgi:NADPH2:quinone reductase
MRAVLCSAFTGRDLRIGQIDEPKPAGDEILTTSMRPP